MFFLSFSPPYLSFIVIVYDLFLIDDYHLYFKNYDLTFTLLPPFLLYSNIYYYYYKFDQDLDIIDRIRIFPKQNFNALNYFIR